MGSRGGRAARWLRADPLIRHEFRARPEDLRMIAVGDDSMVPLLSSGDSTLVDVSRTVPVPPGVFRDPGRHGARRQRVEHIPDSDPARTVIKSANPEYESYERLAGERSASSAAWFGPHGGSEASCGR